MRYDFGQYSGTKLVTFGLKARHFCVLISADLSNEKSNHIATEKT